MSAATRLRQRALLPLLMRLCRAAPRDARCARLCARCQLSCRFALKLSPRRQPLLMLPPRRRCAPAYALPVRAAAMRCSCRAAVPTRRLLISLHRCRYRRRHAMLPPAAAAACCRFSSFSVDDCRHSRRPLLPIVAAIDCRLLTPCLPPPMPMPRCRRRAARSAPPDAPCAPALPRCVARRAWHFCALKFSRAAAARAIHFAASAAATICHC